MRYYKKPKKYTEIRRRDPSSIKICRKACEEWRTV